MFVHAMSEKRPLRFSVGMGSAAAESPRRVRWQLTLAERLSAEGSKWLDFGRKWQSAAGMAAAFPGVCILVGTTKGSAPMTRPDEDLRQMKRGTAVLFATLIETLKEIDPAASDRFTDNLDKAYAKIRNDSDNLNAVELLSWTRELVTGHSIISGGGRPFFDRPPDPNAASAGNGTSE
jgi:hypothetical protein